jgi:hypothetical protein
VSAAAAATLHPLRIATIAHDIMYLLFINPVPVNAVNARYETN